MEFDNQTWKELNRLLDEVLDLPDARRESWLRDMEAHYKEQQPALWGILVRAAKVETQDFLKAPPKIGSPDDAQADRRESQTGSAGETIGPYRLLRELGSGGMGAVWLAERTDGMMKRPVALKLPHDSFIARHAGLAERLEREREILATLNHPNIATLYDAGVDTHGQPYLALEYVEGEPIDRYCAAHSLPIRGRLSLFLQVANAVAHAHAKLIVHRDLKPSNILVTHEGRVRLLDFGIAKLLEQGGGKESPLTELAGRALTPDYAAPEQILGEPITIATDIYSLGVILYELLTGVRPYTLKRDTRGALEDAILQADILKPSEVANGSERKALRGDLDTIVLKALKKQAQDRYATVNTLIEDIERYVEGRAVLAQADSSWYRTRKFVLRNRIAVSAAVAVLMAIFVGAGVAIVQMIEAQAQRDIALASERRSHAISEFMGVLLQDAGATPKTAKELLDRGVEMLDRRPNRDESLSAHMYYELSGLYLASSQTVSELALLRKSEDIANRIGDNELLAASRCSIAWSLAVSDLDAAELVFQSGQQVLAAITYPLLFAATDCVRARARLLAGRGDIAGAITVVEQGLEAIQKSEVNALNRDSLMRTQLVELYFSADRYKDALPLTARNLEEVRDSGRSGTLTELVALFNYAGTLSRLGEFAEAVAALRDRFEADGTGDPGSFWPVGMRAYYGVWVQRLGMNSEALALAEADLILASRDGNSGVMATSNLLASRALLALQGAEAARHRLSESEPVWSAVARRQPRLLREVELQKTDIQLAENDLLAAKSSIDAALAESGYPALKNASALDRLLRTASVVYLRSGDADAAKTFASDAFAISSKSARADRQSADVGLAALLRSEALFSEGDLQGAIADASLAAEALKNGYGANHSDTLRAQRLLARLGVSAPTPDPTDLSQENIPAE